MYLFPKQIWHYIVQAQLREWRRKNYEEENFSNSYGTYIRFSNAYSLWFISR